MLIRFSAAAALIAMSGCSGSTGEASSAPPRSDEGAPQPTGGRFRVPPPPRSYGSRSGGSGGSGAAGAPGADAGSDGRIPKDFHSNSHGLKPNSKNPPPPLDFPTPVACGSATCEPIPIPGTGIKLRTCCANSSAGTCGVAVGPKPTDPCIAANQVATVDPACPTLSAPEIPIALLGCCLNSKCGYVFSIPGGPSFGCVDPTVFGQPQSQVTCK